MGTKRKLRRLEARVRELEQELASRWTIEPDTTMLETTIIAAQARDRHLSDWNAPGDSYVIPDAVNQGKNPFTDETVRATLEQKGRRLDPDWDRLNLPDGNYRLVTHPTGRWLVTP